MNRSMSLDDEDESLLKSSTLGGRVGAVSSPQVGYVWYISCKNFEVAD
jgi:hypothetical protein